MVRMPSPAGMGVRPESRVITTDWLIPGSVYSWRSAASGTAKLDTPGTTSLVHAARVECVHLLLDGAV